jgi:hypothetical protein
MGRGLAPARLGGVLLLLLLLAESNAATAVDGILPTLLQRADQIID